jgi:hypothetical protein
MIFDLEHVGVGDDPRPVLVLGTDDIASAVGHALAGAGIRAVLARDLGLPVLRRAMSFDDAIENGFAELDGVTAYAADLPLLRCHLGTLSVTERRVEELLDPALIEGVIDARMRRRDVKRDLRGALGFGIGLGPGFIAGRNVDLAVETAPEATGRIVRRGETIPAHGRSVPIAGVGRERFSRAPHKGLWWTHRCIGDAVEAGAVVGLCGGIQVRAPHTGSLRGLVRPGSEVPAGLRLLEVDPRGAKAQCRGIPPRAAAIAVATLEALREVRDSPTPAAAHLETASWLT